MNTKTKIQQAKRAKRAVDKLNNANTKPDDTKEATIEKDHIEMSVAKANDLWCSIKKKVKDTPEFVELSDSKKIDIFQKDAEYKDFYTEFPIVCRYMICMGQFSNKAFKKFMVKCKTAKHDPVKSREKGYTEDQWVQRQADYVRYLWEAYQKQHYSPSESNNIWQHAYKTLKQEFKDFRDMHEDIEQKLKVEDQYNKSELVKEMLSRLSSTDQSLDVDTTQNLLKKLQQQVIDQRKRVLIKSIETDVETTPPSRIARGCRQELKAR